MLLVRVCGSPVHSGKKRSVVTFLLFCSEPWTGPGSKVDFFPLRTGFHISSLNNFFTEGTRARTTTVTPYCQSRPGLRTSTPLFHVVLPSFLEDKRTPVQY